MTAAIPLRLRVLLLFAGAALFASALAQPSPAPQPVARSVSPRAAPPPAARREEGPRWQSLSATQRAALAPLEREWPSIDSVRKHKWLTIGDRFGALPADEQTRITARMTEWVRLTPRERGEVRLRYQESRQVASPDRNARWQAYQQLSPEQRKGFAARAAANGPSSARPSAAARKRDGSAKANVVPNPALVPPPRPVAPTMVQATPGATTRPITRLPSPPSHQHTGMPKIAATPEFVNRSTLLPRRGPQAAAVTAPAAPASSQPVPGTTPSAR